MILLERKVCKLLEQVVRYCLLRYLQNLPRILATVVMVSITNELLFYIFFGKIFTK